MGNMEKARESWSAALEADPQYEEAKQRLESSAAK
jgi:hypothetical protein